MIRHSGRLLTALLAALLLWAPLPFGGVTPWAAASLQVLSFSALALAAFTDRPRALRPVLPLAAAVAAVALFGVAQSLPWPARLVSLLSPGHAELVARAAALPGAAAGPPHLSLAPAGSRAAALLWAAAAAALLAGAMAGRWRENRRWLAGSVLLGGLFQALFGAREQLRRSPTLWGVEAPISPRLHGTFVNPNHAALYLELALAIAFAWGWWALRRARGEPLFERRLLLVAGPLLAWLTLLAGLVLSGSRGGLLAALVGMTAQGMLAAGVRGRWRSALLGLGAAVTGLLVVVLSIGLHAGLGRLVDTQGSDAGGQARLTEYAAVLRLWRHFPFFGAGLGSFQEAFPRVQPADLLGTWVHAHSDVLELIATTGVVGVLLLAVGVAALSRRLFAVLRGYGRSEDRAAALAAFGILAVLTVHELLDFGLTMPANALTVAVLTGAAAAVEAKRARAASAQPDRARHDPAAGDALDLQDVGSRTERSVGGQGTRRLGRQQSAEHSVQP